MPEEQLAPLEFPVNGLDLTQGFGAQRPGTTPVGTNVRTFETLTQRGRGGSRQGLSRYVLPQLPTAAKIQCLDYVVDPSADALLANYGNGNLSDPGILDPSTNPPGSMSGDGRFRNPGNKWRTGGSGIQPNRNKKITINNPVSGTVTANPTSVMGDGVTPSEITVNVMDRYNFPVEGDSISLSTSPSGRVGDGVTGTTDGFGNFQVAVTDNQQETVIYTAQDTTRGVTIGSASVNYGGWQFVQAIAGGSINFFTLMQSFTGTVTAGNLLLAAAGGEDTYTVQPVISDTQGNAWNHLGQISVTNQSNLDTLDVWWAVANATGACTITVVGNAGQNQSFVNLLQAEYSGNTASPFDVVQTLSSPFANRTSPVSGQIVSASGNGEAIIAIFYQHVGNFGTGTAGAGGFTSRVTVKQLLLDNLGVNAGSYTPMFSFTNPNIDLAFVTFSMSFK